MQFPKFQELDRDQRHIYQSNTKEGAALITGPPGCGKTVIAMHRAVKLHNGHIDTSVAVFNKVLSRYTGNFMENMDGVGPNFIVEKSIYQWVNKWWLRFSSSRYFPKEDYPPGRKKGWREYDWVEAKKRVNELKGRIESVYWGHLIIDEGQDHPPQFYELLFYAMNEHNQSVSLEKKISLTVFADENQTITDKNSSIQEISEELNVSVKNKSMFRLDKNYRNTREIAKFSQYFQLSGKQSTSLPDNQGIKPIIGFIDEYSHAIKIIVNRARNAGNIKIGVICFGESYNKGGCSLYSMVGMIEAEVAQDDDICFNGYMSNNNKYRNPEDLDFEHKKSITAVHQASAKGLEFDEVYVFGIEVMDIEDGAEMDLAKKLYVVSSRARNKLIFYIKVEDFGRPLIKQIRIFPKPERDLCTYQYMDDKENSSMRIQLKKIDWLESVTDIEKTRAMSNGIVNEIYNLSREAKIDVLKTCAFKRIKTEAIVDIIEDRADTMEGIADLIVEFNLPYNYVREIIKELGYVSQKIEKSNIGLSHIKNNSETYEEERLRIEGEKLAEMQASITLLVVEHGIEKIKNWVIQHMLNERKNDSEEMQNDNQIEYLAKEHGIDIDTIYKILEKLESDNNEGDKL